ncbi:MAG: hypothetical protein WC975_15585 [Phycisphaerae bacterium]
MKALAEMLVAVVLMFSVMAQAQVVNSIANVRALPGGLYSEVRTLGYYAAGDGGHSTYRWNASSTDADDGGITIAPNSGTGRWKLLYDGSVRIRQYGAKGDGVADDQTAIYRANVAMFVGGGEIIFTKGAYKISDNISFYENVTVRMMEGASFKGTHTIFFSGFFDAGLYKVFDPETEAFFDNGCVVAAYPEWWGAVGNGTADDSIPVQRAINSVMRQRPYTEGSKVIFTGLYGANQRIQVVNAMGLEITGTGSKATGLVWIGVVDPTAVVFETSNIYYCRFQNFMIDANNKAGIGHLIYNYNTAQSTPYPIGTHENFFDELQNMGSTEVALKIGQDLYDYQIDWLYFTNCHFSGQKTLVRMTGSNTFHILFNGGEANDFTGIAYDLVSGGQVHIKGVGWLAGGAPGGAPVGTYVKRGVAFGTVTIEEVQLEGNALVLEAPDDSGSANNSPILMSGNNFGYTGITTGYKLVDYQQKGAFISKGDKYGANPNGGSSAQLYFKVPGSTGLVLLDGINTPIGEVEVVSEGNTLVTGFSKQGIFTVGERIFLGNKVSRSIGVYVSNLQIEKAGSVASQSISTQSPDSQGSNLTLHKSRGTTLGSNTIVQNGDTIGTIVFAASDGNDPDGYVASITAQLEGTPGNNDLPGNLVFGTTRDGQNGPTETLRLTPDGDTKATGNVRMSSVGKGLRIKEGTNARMGVATLVAGIRTVSNTNVTANTRIFISRSTSGGTRGHLAYVINPGKSFTVYSSTTADISTFSWLLIEPD